jgi:hypothetical protein
LLDKTKLEHDIEQYEETAVPLWARLLIILLFVIICSLGLYSFKLNQDISGKEEEMVKIKEHHSKERSELLKNIKKLENSACNVTTDLNRND